MIWTDKHSPKLEDIPHRNEIEIIIHNLKEKNPILLHGPSGVGKTTAVIKIAEAKGYELLEINASDKRNKEEITNLIGNATQQLSLFGKPKLILIDEIDGVSGTQDRGGIATLNKIIASTKAAIVMTCNDIKDQRLKTLKKKCHAVEFKQPEVKEVQQILKNIANKENIEHKDLTLSSLARRCDGDIRAAIIDMQVNSAINKNLNIDFLDERNNKEQIQNALTIIFKSKNFNLTSKALNNLDVSLDECFLWLEYNLPKEYQRVDDIERSLEKLSKADIFKSRIIRRQYWRLLVYQNILMTAGVALAKKERYPKKPSYKATSRIFRIWMANQKNHKKKLIATKISETTHCSIHSAIKTYNQYKTFLVNDSIKIGLELSDDEIKYLKK